MQDTHYKSFRALILVSTSKIIIIDIKIVKTIASFLVGVIFRIITFFIIVIIDYLRDIFYKFIALLFLWSFVS